MKVATMMTTTNRIVLYFSFYCILFSFAGPGFSDYVPAEEAIRDYVVDIYNKSNHAIKVQNSGCSRVIRPRKHVMLDCCKYQNATLSAKIPFSLDCDVNREVFSYPLSDVDCGRSIIIN